MPSDRRRPAYDYSGVWVFTQVACLRPRVRRNATALICPLQADAVEKVGLEDVVKS
jgi:hypothetical protein